MGLNQVIHRLNIEQLLWLYISLPDITGIYGDEMGLTDFETGLFTYIFLKGDIGKVVVFTRSGRFYFIDVKKAILTGD